MCQLSKKKRKKLDSGGGSQKVLVITESIRRLVIEVHRIVARSLALSSSEHIVRREEAKVQLAMAEWMSLSMVVYCLFGLIISGGNSAKVASLQWAHQLADQALKTDRMRRSQSHFVSR